MNIQIEFTNGIGNNLFQYIYARLIAEDKGGGVSVVFKDGSEYAKGFFSQQGIQLKTLDNPDQKLSGYFEDYNFYINHIDQIRSWFKPVEKINTKDLVFHLRLGDRLFMKETYRWDIKIEPFQYVEAIHKFDFNRLHIVTDMKVWQHLTEKSLSNMCFHRGGPGGTLIKNHANDREAIEYFNAIFDTLNEFKPIVRRNCSISDDFDYMRSFGQILFQHSTLAWWAAMLSKASRVGVYGPWRPQKGSNNKNLSQVKLPAWFQWF